MLSTAAVGIMYEWPPQVLLCLMAAGSMPQGSRLSSDARVADDPGCGLVKRGRLGEKRGARLFQAFMQLGEGDTESVGYLLHAVQADALPACFAVA